MENPTKNELYGDPKKLTSSRIIGVGEGKFQVEAGRGRQGFSVRLDNSKMAKFIGDMFYRAANHINN